MLLSQVPAQPPGAAIPFMPGETAPGSQGAAGTVSQDTPDPDAGWRGRLGSPCAQTVFVYVTRAFLSSHWSLESKSGDGCSPHLPLTQGLPGASHPTPVPGLLV